MNFLYVSLYCPIRGRSQFSKLTGKRHLHSTKLAPPVNALSGTVRSPPPHHASLLMNPHEITSKCRSNPQNEAVFRQNEAKRSHSKFAVIEISKSLYPNYFTAQLCLGKIGFVSQK